LSASDNFKIIFNIGNGKDIEDISRCMSLTEEERNFIDWLDVGHAIVSLKGRVKVPLHVVFPKVGVKKGTIPDSTIIGHGKVRTVFN